MSMLCLRAFLIDPHLPSPAESLYQRKLHGLIFPSRLETKHRTARDEISQRLTERQQLTKRDNDRSAHDLIPLTAGQLVHIQDQTTKKWFLGVISNTRPEPRSCEVQTQ